jgi:hypothetical protein
VITKPDKGNNEISPSGLKAYGGGETELVG